MNTMKKIRTWIYCCCWDDLPYAAYDTLEAAERRITREAIKLSNRTGYPVERETEDGVKLTHVGVDTQRVKVIQLQRWSK